MNTYKMRFTRSYVTYVDVIASDEIEARVQFDVMLDDGTIYDMELEQCNVCEENVELILPTIRKVHDDGRIVGTSFHGCEVEATVHELIDLLGDPRVVQNTGRDKTNFEWWMEMDGEAFTVYDWKEYRTIGLTEMIHWHIGGRTNTERVRKHIDNLLKLKRK